jgi:hypothetical protein
MRESVHRLTLGNASVQFHVKDGFFVSIGDVSVGGVPLRNPAARFRPWFDRYEGGVFHRFRFLGVSERDDGATAIDLEAVGDDEAYPFRERRDASGDLCFRDRAFDAPPETASLSIVFRPASATVGGRAFSGFTYGYEYDAGELPIHRLADLATWEVGGNLDDVTLLCRNWLTPPRMRLARDAAYSTVGLDSWANLLPGNLWGRWTLLPGFDLQYGKAGILAGWFDRVSLVRTVIETAAGEDALRVSDLHWFEQSGHVRTNPKTIAFCPDRLDDTDALNLWTAFQDRDRDMGRAQFGIPEEEPPRLSLSQNVWHDFHFDTTYEDALAIAGEFGMDQLFVDVCWEQGESLRMAFNQAVPPEKRKGTVFEKFEPRNMCCVYDLEVAEEHGGEAALKRLCDRAAEKGVKVISWMAAHITPSSTLVDGERGRTEFRHGAFGPCAAMESGRHPSGGYASSCWTLDLNGPVYGYLRDSILGVCERTGLDGFLWDSYCNMGWWQVGYSDGSMRPQFDKMGELLATLVRAGLYIQPEAIVSFSSHSCCGLHGGNIYAGDLLGYSYDTMFSLWNTGIDFREMLRGNLPATYLFECFAHRRAPGFDAADFLEVPREEWDDIAAETIRFYFTLYKIARGEMVRRTVLHDGNGVLWANRDNVPRILWSFREQDFDGDAADLVTGAPANGKLLPWRVYLVRS